MSEMQANQYFISGRYSEAFSEYLKLSNKRQNDINIKEKILISATLDEKFEYALKLLTKIFIEKADVENKMSIDYSECPCTETVTKLENDMKQKNLFSDEMKMKIAILSFFSDQNKSVSYFKMLKGSVYADIVNPFFNFYLKNSK